MIVLPVRQTVLFPGIVLPLTVGRKSSIAAAQEAVRTERMLGVVLQKDPAIEEPTADQLHAVGTAAQVLRYVTAPDGTHHVIAQGVRRFRVIEYLGGFPFLVARIEEIGIAEVMTPEIEARVRLVRGRAQDVMQLLPNVPGEVAATIEHLDSPSALADFIAGILDAKPAEKQDVLETIDVKERLDKVLALLAQRFEVLKISKEIGDQTQQSLSSQQREHILREQLRHIQKELGEGDEKSTEVAELREAIEKAGMPQEAEDQAKKELKRLERMPDASPEFGMIRSYLDWLIGLPWSKSDPDAIDIAEARRILDEDHYGLPKIKRRILEYLAVRKLNPNGRSPILCFVGPPGVGKTSLGQSIAKATGRKVRAAEPRRRARRSRDQGPPAHLYRCAARQHHPVDSQGRDAQSGDDARRGGQAWAGLPRRSVIGAARSARPRAELDVPRQLPRRGLRPLQGDVHRHRQRAGYDPGPGARPHGGHRASRLHRGRKARNRQALSAQASARADRPRGRPMRDHRGRDPHDHPRLHA